MSRRRLALVAAGVIGLLALAALAARALAVRELAFMLLGRRYELQNPELLAALLLWPLLPLSMIGSLSDLPLAQRVLSLGARSLLLALIALALARPLRMQDATAVSAVMLVDVSDSVSDADLALAKAQVQHAISARGKNDLELVTFAAGAHRVALPQRPGALLLERHAPEPGQPPPNARTDIQAGLQHAYGLFRPGRLRRVLLLTDGRQTDGDLLGEATRAAGLGVRVYHQLVGRERPTEVAVQALELPERIAVGESFELRAQVFSTYATTAKLRLYQDALLNGLDGAREVQLARGMNPVVFKSIVRAAGQVAYKLTLDPSGPDRFRENNAVTATAVVSGRPSVLLVGLEPDKLRDAARALSLADYEVELRSAAALPTTLGELARYDFLVLSNLPAERFSADQLDAIERYVRDLGGGVMVAGGAQSFGLGGYQGTRLEELLPLHLDSERRRDERSLALALVIDCSGSMSGQKIELAKDAAREAAELLGQDDSLAVVGFSGEPERIVRMQSARNRLRIGQNIARLSAQGGTAIFPALDMAFQDLLATTARVKHVILLTDGQTQESGISELVQSMRSEGITISTVGLGNDVNRSLLQQTASAGGGRAYFTADPHNVPRIFVRETTTVGQNSAVEELVRMRRAEPADFLKGIDLEQAPMLRGYIATRAKPKPAQVILASDMGEPLLARWRVGLGWVLAWTSDIEPRWASELLRWHALPSLLGQLVREHMRAQRHDDLPMRATLDGDELLVSVDATSADDRFLDGLDSSVTIEGPIESEHQRLRTTLPLLQRAPGRYEARLRLDRYGSFALEALHRQDDRVIARSHGQVSHPYPLEYATREPDGGLLQAVSAATRGRALGDASQLFDPGGERLLAPHDVWPQLVLAALGLFLLDVLLRRVRLIGRATDG
ncbi:MAG: VWA domain-containing protein [Polyangiales bacterium]